MFLKRMVAGGAAWRLRSASRRVAVTTTDERRRDTDADTRPRQSARSPTAPVKIAFSVPGGRPRLAEGGRRTTPRRPAKSSATSTSRSTTAPTNSADQADQIETLIAGKPDALVVLPFEGDALTPVAQKATEAGIPVDQHRPRVLRRRARSAPGSAATTTASAGRPATTSPTSSSARATSSRSRASPASRSPSSARKGFDDALKRRCKGGIKIVAQPARRLRPGEGPRRDGEHPPGAEADRRRLHA